MRDLTSSLVGFLLTAALGTTAGLIGGVLYVRAQTPPPRVLVLDVRRLVQPIASDPTLDALGRRARTDELSRAVSKIAGEQAARGAIVLDGSAVLRAPPEVYVEP